MVLRKKNLVKVFTLQLQIALVVFFVILFLEGSIRAAVKEQLMTYVAANMDFLKLLIFFTFLTGALILFFIVWLLEYGDRKQKSIVTQYISRMVCENYYGDYRKTNVYRAIKTCISKFSRNDSGEVESDPNDSRRSRVRYIDPRRYPLKNYTAEKMSILPTSDTSDGVHTMYYPNGKIEKEVSYKDNQLDGIFRTYYEDGTLHQERVYKAGKLHGPFKAYDESGIAYFDLTYQNGKREGVMNIYNKNGVLEYRDTYRNNKRVNRKTYSESGELKFSQNE